MKTKQLYKFGEFSLCPDERNLSRGDDNISLTPKMYELLLVLVQNQNRILEKEFLLQAVWPDSFVEEGNITFNIRQLRIALGDDAQEPLYIETIPRRGYRFIANVTSQADNGTGGEAIEEGGKGAVKTVNGSRSMLFAAAAVFVLLAAVIGSAVWFSRTTVAQSAPILSAPFASEKLSTDGRVYHTVLTPDGKTLVYTRGVGGKQSLWLRQIETSNNVQIIPPAENVYGGLAISTDANTIFFTRGLRFGSSSQIDVYRVPIVGGVPQKLVESTQGWISVSPDSKKISYVRCPRNEDDYCSLWIADAIDGKNERKLVTRPRPIRIGDNKISPDGRKIAFAVGQSRTASNEFSFAEVDIQTGVERELTTQKFFNINYLEWLPDQSGWLLTARVVPDRSSRIWQISAASGDATILTADSESYHRLSLDAKGSLLVATRVEPSFNLNVYKTDDPDAAPQVLTNASSVSFAPNGKIFYSSIMTGDPEIWSINADGSEQRQLTIDPADDISPIVSPDNRSIFFQSNRTGKSHVWRMDPDGTNQIQVTKQDGGFPLRVSPDGQWVYYRSGLSNTLRRVSLQDGREEVVYDPSGEDIALTPDTSRIALTSQKAGETIFTIVSLADRRILATFRSPDPTRRPVYVIWSQDGKDLVYVLEDDKHESRTLWFQGMADAEPRRISELRAGEVAEISGFAVSYDAKYFAAVQGSWLHNAVLIKGLKQ